MPLLKDRVLETTTSSGTGIISFGGAKVGYQSFSSAFSSGDVIYYCISNGVNWEVGSGVVTSGSPWTLTRSTILASSNANAIVNFPVGTKDVFCTAAAAGIVRSINGNSGDITAAQILSTLLTVDGSGSGLDADLLDGNHASAFSLSGHTHSYQAADGDLLAIGGLVGTSGLLRKNAADTWSLDTTGYTTNTGTVTSVGGTGTVSGLTLSGTVSTSGNLTLSGTLAVSASNFSSQTSNTFLAAPNGSADVPTFRNIVASDIPTLNQNTTGNSATANQLQAFVGDDFTDGGHYVKAIRSSSGWATRLKMGYLGGTSMADSVSVSYADYAGSATDSSKLPLTGGTMSGFLTISSSAGGDFYTAYKVGAGYGDSSGACYLAKTDNTNGASNFFHKGFAGTTATFSIRADGQISSFGSEGKAVVSYLAPSYSVGDIVSGHSYHWYSDNWRIGGSRGGDTDMADFKFQLNGVDKLKLNVNGDLTAIGSIAAANISTGITANHIVQRDGSGYILASHINLSTTETENATLNSFITSNGDGWTRKASKAHVISQLGLITSGNIASQSVSYANTAGSATDSSKLPLTGGTISGNLTVTGEIAAASKSFLIPHPTKQGMKLRYGSLESPYHGVRLTGNGVLVKGKCRIDLPEYISKLCKQEGTQVQLTNIKHGKAIWVNDIDIENNCFDVECDIGFFDKKEYHFYWSLTAIRKDISDLKVEE